MDESASDPASVGWRWSRDGYRIAVGCLSFVSAWHVGALCIRSFLKILTLAEAILLGHDVFVEEIPP